MTYRGLAPSLWKKMNGDNMSGLSAQVSFYFVLAMFPFLISLAALVRILPFTGLSDNVLSWIVLSLPGQARHFVFQTVAGLRFMPGGFQAISLIGTAWAAASGVMSLMEALNVAYNVEETRSYFYRICFSLFAVFILATVFVATFGLLAMGNLADTWLATLLHSTHSFFWLWHSVRWLLSFLLTALGMAVIDNWLPDHKRSWKWITPGSLFTVFAWVFATSGFNFYLFHFGSYLRTYGSLGTFVILMIWIYIMSLMTLIGAEINYQLSAVMVKRVYPGN